MASNSVAHVISPLKFMLLLMNIMLVITVAYQRDEFIFSKLRQNYTKSSSEYSDSDDEFIVAITLFLVTMV